MFKSIAFFGLAALAAAAPSNSRGGNTGLKTTSYNANFDNLGTSVAATTSIGPYDGLNYQGIGLYHRIIRIRKIL